MFGYLVAGAVALGAAVLGWRYKKAHEVPPGALSYGPGMYGLDAGIPPEVAQTVFEATQLEVDPAKLRDLAAKTDALGKSRGTPWPLAVHVLMARADYVARRDRAAGLK